MSPMYCTFEGAARLDGGAVSFATPCFGAVHVTASMDTNTSDDRATGQVEVTIEATRRKALGCIAINIIGIISTAIISS